VVLDPIVLANTGKVPDGPSAKLLTLLAYGQALAYLNEGANAEARWLQKWLPGTPQDLGHGWASKADSAYGNTFANRQALVQSIPPGGRSLTLCLALSESLIDRVVRQVGRLRDQQGVELDDDVLIRALRIRAPVQLVEQWDLVPDYTGTGSTDSNVSIHTALRAGAPLVVTRLPDACEPADLKIYRPIESSQAYPLGSTGVVHLDWLVELLSNEFDFHAIDAGVLERIAPSGPQRSE